MMRICTLWTLVKQKLLHLNVLSLGQVLPWGNPPLSLYAEIDLDSSRLIRNSTPRLVAVYYDFRPLNRIMQVMHEEVAVGFDIVFIADKALGLRVSWNIPQT